MPPALNRVGRTSWSSQIAERYQCSLPGDLIRWFDEEVWRVRPGVAVESGFTEALAPDALLQPTPEAIWPALMPCNFLPLLGNRLGDWLCLRFGHDNSVRDVVHWYHGGGDWIPWGNTLSEALLFDALQKRLPGESRQHAIPADAAEPLASHDGSHLHDWAIESLRDALVTDPSQLSGRDLAKCLLDSQLCQPAILCQLVIEALDRSALLSQHDTPPQCEDANWQRVQFDHELATGEMKARFEGTTQDWASAELRSEQCNQVAPDLSWAWEIRGYALERRGQLEAATAAYEKALDCSSFTDQSVRLRTHGFTPDGQKFAASRMLEQGLCPNHASRTAYLNCLNVDSGGERRRRVFQYFRDQAMAASGHQAHQLWMRAGWDMGAEPMSVYGEILRSVSTSAEQAGYIAESTLASVHRDCFKSRYGIE
ncbi:MAG: SMI1/KNR4 family protein [Planctomycetota bacterium]